MNDLFKTILPWIGTALGGPLGAIAATTVGKVLGLDDKSVESVKNVLSGMSSDDLLKLREADMTVQIQLANMGYSSLEALTKLEVQAIESVNKTMQAESAAEHWPSYSWRPYNGFLFGTTIFMCYVILPLLKITPPIIPAEIWLSWGAILGVASYFRGKAQADPNIPPAIQIPANHSVINKLTGKD